MTLYVKYLPNEIGKLSRSRYGMLIKLPHQKMATQLLGMNLIQMNITLTITLKMRLVKKPSLLAEGGRKRLVCHSAGKVT